MTNPAWLIRTMCGFAVVGCLAGTVVLGQLPLARVGIAWDGPSQQNDALGLTFKTEIELILKDEFDVRFPADKSLEADWTAEGVKDVIDGLLADPGIDLVLALGVLTSHEMARRTKLPKPVFAPFVLNPKLQGIPSEIRERPLARPGETERVRISGIRNLSYVTAGVDLLRDVTQFQEITPFSRLAVLTLESLEKAGVGSAAGIGRHARASGSGRNPGRSGGFFNTGRSRCDPLQRTGSLRDPATALVGGRF